MSKKIIPVFFAVDDNFVKYTVVSLKSIIDNASKEYNYEIYVLHTNVSEKYQRILSELENENFTVTFVDVTSYLNNIKDKLPVRDYYSMTTYFRMFIADMFPQYDKAIYIDSDTVVLGDISEMYNFNIEGKYLGVFQDRSVQQLDLFADYVENVLGVKRNDYFNAGVLLINCYEFRKNEILKEFIRLINFYTFKVAQDQDYLNVICNHKTIMLDGTWDTQIIGEVPYEEEDINVLHYVFWNKPWHDPDCRYKDYFWFYAKKTVVYEEILSVLNAYTDEERARDQRGLNKLCDLVNSELARPDNYLRRTKNPYKKNVLRRTSINAHLK